MSLKLAHAIYPTLVKFFPYFLHLQETNANLMLHWIFTRIVF